MHRIHMNFANRMENAKFFPTNDITKTQMINNGYSNFCVPLSMLIDFCKDYKYVVINVQHELILI